MSISLEPLGHLIKEAQHRHHRAMDGKLAALGLSLVQWNALREIDRNPNVSMQRLSELTFNSNQAFGTLTTRLLRDGLIERHHGAGRAIKHSLTAKGESLLFQGRPLVLDVLARSFAPLNADERNVLSGLLAKLLSNTDNFNAA